MPSLPILTWLPSYQRRWLRADLIAGLAVWALVVPQGIAYAQIAGLPPAAGVFATFAAPLALGDPAKHAGLSAALAIVAGAVMLLLGWRKMEFVSQFVGTSVQVGFLFGLGLTIIVGQAAKLLGVSGADGPFYRQFWHLLTHLGEANGWTVAVGLVSLAAMVGFKRLAPALPAALIVVLVAIALSAVLSLPDRGVAVVGEVERALPLPAIPAVSFDELTALLVGALAIVVIGYSESELVAEQLADEHRYRVRPNQELIALGVASAAGGLFRGFITAGGASQSIANDRAGAKTPLAAIVLSLLTLLTAVTVLPVFGPLPVAVLGAIVVSVVVGFLNVRELRRVAALSREAFAFALVALASVLVLGVLPGLLVTVALSILLLLGRASRPASAVLGRLPGTPVYVDAARHPEAETEPGLLVVRPNAPLLFINAGWTRDSVRSRIGRQEPPPRVVLLDLESSHTLDVKSLDMLVGFGQELRERGIDLWLVNVRSGVHDVLRRGAVGSEPRIFRTFDDGVEAFRSATAPGVASISGT